MQKISAAAVAFAIAAVGLVALHASPAKAVLLGNGTFYPAPYGGATCADVRYNSLTPGEPVQAYQCIGGANQQFQLFGWTIYTEGGHMCLDQPDGGATVVSNPCNGSMTQQWQYVGGNNRGFNGGVGGQLQNWASSACLDAGNQANGTQLVAAQCIHNVNSASQQWEVKSALLSNGNGYGPPYGGFACADVSNNNPASGTVVQVWQCVGGPNQLFSLMNNTIFTEGGQKCLDASGPGGTAFSNNCNGSYYQTWYYGVYSPGTLTVGFSEYCLDAGNQAEGTQLVVNSCNNSDSQQWQFK